MQGWFKMYRCLLEKPMFNNAKLLKVFIWCLCKATHKKHKQLVGRQLVSLEPGQFVTGRNKAAQELDMKPSTAWEYLKLLETNETINISSDSKYSIVTLVNWELYQLDNNNSDSKHDSKSTANQQQINTNKNVKNGNNEKNNNVPYSEIVYFLNKQTGKNFKTTSGRTKDLINARFNEGYTFEDFKTVIVKKSKQWKNHKDMNKYLRPETLFSNKFEGYLNEKEINNISNVEVIE